MRLQCGAVINRIPAIHLTIPQTMLWLKWAEELESGKYKQTTFCLRDDTGFCPLGIACNMIDPDGWKKIQDGYSFQDLERVSRGLDTTTHLPRTIRSQLGGNLSPLGFSVGGRFPDGEGNTIVLRNFALSSLNDIGATFHEIGLIIRYAASGGYRYELKMVEEMTV
jgi:hypothetical protein